jgi:hypothetical protein
MFDLCFTFESANSNELDYIVLKSLSETLSKKYVKQCAFDLEKLRFNLKYENDELVRYFSNVCRDAHIEQVSFDIIFSSGIRISVINFLNRSIFFLSNFKYINQKSEINVEKYNNTICSISASIDYEISKYFRLFIGINPNSNIVIMPI